ncbi:putative fungistatic metabolite [Rhypophila decipiens]|uniref:Fungistatic metabolite n=1 Tax=Rhypophila decipiens TaxID=261697 RepID=A0AAN6YM71_9PEZI|nr:putative fungistatic metabolite [Rhypophila decipiens]
MRTGVPVFAGLLALAARGGRADPTWPAPTDEMEEILYQLQGFKGRLFNDQITPCNNEAAGPGRVTASEWLRIGFHDMATRNRFSDVGGLDGSIQFEVNNSENTGPGHNTTLKWFSNFLSARSSLADLIAAGVYASVRGCGGPIVPVRGGRVDAAAAGPIGVPQPENSVVSFRNAFDRMGFSSEEMIQVTACGHTLGGVHREEFPGLVPEGMGVNGQIGLDSTVAGFDNKIVTEYLDGTSQNVLVRPVAGTAFANQRNSDFKVFNSDFNVTMNTMTAATAFNNICATVLQKMIDTVPSAVTLSDPIAPYTIKPVDMQLTLNPGGTSMFLSGYIRLRTTNIPIATVRDLTFTWKDRAGGNNCGSGSCSRTFTHQGGSTGFDDTFVFYPIEITMPASSGISQFTVRLNMNDGSSQTFDNNGNAYPLSDGVILQKPQSCLAQSTGAVTVTALVRNDITETPDLFVSYPEPRPASDRNPVPALKSTTIAMTKGACVGVYTFYSASYTIPGGRSFNARLTVTAGSETDDFNKAADITGTCVAFTGSATCTTNTTPSSVSSSVGASSTRTSTSTARTSTSTTGTPTPSIPQTLGGYRFVSCWTEGTGVRALGGAAYAYDGMTLESCMGNCTGFDYWGTEYGRECYCGNSLASSSQSAPVGDCNMLCAGNPLQYCGAGNRIVLTSTVSTTSTTSTSTSSSAAATGTLARKPVVGAYTLVGCQTEATGARALSANSYAADTMTLESCATFCSGYTYFGTEYGRECYCGNALNAGSIPAAQSDCSMVCAGNPFEYCGAGNRLELYKLTVAVSSSSSSLSSSSSSSTSSTAAATSTLAHRPTISPFTLAGCYTEGVGSRALSEKSYASGTSMTLQSCATFCSGYKYFGTEYGSECYCGNVLHSTSTNVTLAECSMPCSGNPFQYCGAGNRLELYVNPSWTSGGVTGPSHPATVAGGWGFYNCMTEGTSGRALAAKAYAAADMTLDACAAFCTGYTYFGTEYASECYCGNSFAAGSVPAGAVGECGMTCSGNGNQYCGAGNRLSVYSHA